MPIVFQLEVTTRCRLRCVECSRRETVQARGLRDIDIDVVRHVTCLHCVSNGKIVLSGFGEPLLHPEIDEVLSLILASGARCALYTSLCSDISDSTFDLLKLMSDKCNLGIAFSPHPMQVIHGEAQLGLHLPLVFENARRLLNRGIRFRIR